MQNDALWLECAGLSVVGRRKNNEDAFLLRPKRGLFAVADGMGGYEGGEVASATVIGALDRMVAHADLDPEGTWPLRERAGLGPLESLVEVALRVADREVKARRSGTLAQMGSTASVVLVRGGRLAIGHVGDSRVYRLRGGLVCLTEDHSVAAELRRSGMEPGEIAPRLAACLTRAIGMSGPAVPDVCGDTLLPGDVYLLCSDGLWGVLDDAIIEDILQTSTASDACHALIEAAHEAGSDDNITAVVVRVHGSPRIL